jgi:hypothetical protein
VLSSHPTAANATLPGHNQRGWGKKALAAFAKKDSEKSSEKRGA